MNLLRFCTDFITPFIIIIIFFFLTIIVIFFFLLSLLFFVARRTNNRQFRTSNQDYGYGIPNRNHATTVDYSGRNKDVRRVVATGSKSVYLLKVVPSAS